MAARTTSDIMAGDRVRVTYFYPARGMVKAGTDAYEGVVERIYQVPNKDWHVQIRDYKIVRTDEDGVHDLKEDRPYCVLVHPYSTERGKWEIITE